MPSLLNRLETFRLERRMSQQELARRLGVSFITVNRWFNGHQNPRKMQRYHIRKLLKEGGK